MSSAVVLSSGGINSATVFEIALRAHRPDTVYMVSFEYESKYNEQERLASLDLYSYYTDKGENVTWEPIEITGPNIEPFLDGILLSRAASYAFTKRASYIYTDVSGNNATEFLGSMAAAIYIASHQNVQLKFPLIWMTSVDIIKRALNLEVPANLTWSCSQPTTFTDDSCCRHCGVCSTCIDRIVGFRELGVTDPVPYAIEVEWRGNRQWPYIGERQLRAREL